MNHLSIFVFSGCPVKEAPQPKVEAEPVMEAPAKG